MERLIRFIIIKQAAMSRVGVLLAWLIAPGASLRVTPMVQLARPASSSSSHHVTMRWNDKNVDKHAVYGRPAAVCKVEASGYCAALYVL